MAGSLTTVTEVAQIPSVFSEMDVFAANEEYEEYAAYRWGLDCGDKTYIGGEYVTNEVFTMRNGVLTHLGRMTLPRPIKMTGDTSATDIVTANAADDYGTGPTTGDIDGDTTFDTRYYRVAFANENTAPGFSDQLGGDSTLPDGDARRPENQVPIGAFGQLSEIEQGVTLAAGNTVVSLTDVLSTAPAEYQVTHAYVFASSALRADGGTYYYVGKMENLGSGNWSTLYDTLSWNVLVNRAPHTEDFLAVPSFVKAVRWGNRIVGITGADQQLSTDFTQIYVKVTNESRTIEMVDNAGNALTDDWPRWIEHGGALIQIQGQDRNYEVDQIDAGNRSRFFVTTPYEGPNNNSRSFTMRSTNDLFICYANLQQQEQCRAAYIRDAAREIGAPLVSLIPDPFGDSLLLFARDRTYALSNLPDAESIDSGVPYTGEIVQVSYNYGVAGPNAVCAGPDSVYGLSDSGFLMITTAGVTDITEDVTREWIRQRSDTDKRRAVMVYDPVRKLVLTLIGDDVLVFDTQRTAFTVWNGGGWRYAAVASARAAGNTGEGGGSKLLFQTDVGDLVMMDEALSVDNVNTPTDTYGNDFEVTGTLSGGTVITVDTSAAQISPECRARVVVTSGSSRGSVASLDLTQTQGPGSFTVQSWSDGAPAVGDRVTLGGIRVRFQTGAFIQANATVHNLMQTRMELDSDSTDTNARVYIELFGGGETSLLPDPDAATTTRTAALSAIRSRIDIPLPRVSMSRRQGFGLDWVEPEDDGLRFQSVELLTSGEGER